MKISHQAHGLLAVILITVGAQAQSGTELWHYPTGGSLLSSPALSRAGIIYVGAYDQQLYAINASSGALVWKFSVAPPKANETAYIYSSPAISPTGIIYFGTEERTSSGGSSGTFYAVNPDGTLKWKYPIAAAIYSDPSIGADGTIYFGAFDNNLYALNPDGTLKWKYAAGSTIFSDSVIAADGTIYFGCDDHNIYALNSSGVKKWTFDTGGPITASPAIGPDGTVYVGTTSSLKFFAINPDGTEKWAFQATERVYSSAALGADGTIYFGSNDGKFYALNGNGSLKWVFQAAAAVRSSPALAADGTLYVGSDDGNVYAINSQGNLVWKFPTAQKVYSSPVVGPGGTVYVGSSDNSLYAISGTSALASTPWPMLHHDALHTGRAVATTANTPPAISAIADQTIQQNGTVGPLNFTISDVETPASSLSLTVTSSDTSLVSTTNIIFGGSGGNRTVTISPVTNRTGSATITLTVTDGGGSTAKTSFVLTVNAVTAVNHAPTLDPIPNQTISQGSTLTLTVKATDSDIPTNHLTFTLPQSPQGAIIDPSTGALTWTPTSAQSNTTNLFTVRVTDDGVPPLSAQISFTVTVTPSAVAPPSIQTINISNGSVTITWSAISGKTYRVQYTSTLETISWQDLAGDVLAQGLTASKTDASSLNSRRFYRVLLLQGP